MFYVAPYNNFFAVWQRWEQLLIEEDPQPDRLVAVCVYKKGAAEVKRRLEGRVAVKRKIVICRDCRKGDRAAEFPETAEGAEAQME